MRGPRRRRWPSGRRLAYYREMFGRPGKKSLRLPHVALMLVLAFGLLAQSLIDLSGQTHEALLHAEAGQAYTHHHETHEHDAPHPGDTDEDAGSALHLLMHQPCGTHCVWMPGAPVTRVLTGMVSALVPFDTIGPIYSAERTVLFRPPIQA